MISDKKILDEFKHFCGEKKFSDFLESVKQNGGLTAEDQALFNTYLLRKKEIENETLNELLDQYTDEQKNFLLACPEKACYGIVSFTVDIGYPWGCGECGAVWENLNKLSDQIDEITSVYGYRSCCYEKTSDGTYKPAKEENIIDDYFERVEDE